MASASSMLPVLRTAYVPYSSRLRARAIWSAGCAAAVRAQADPSGGAISTFAGASAMTGRSSRSAYAEGRLFLCAASGDDKYMARPLSRSHSLKPKSTSPIATHLGARDRRGHLCQGGGGGGVGGGGGGGG